MMTSFYDDVIKKSNLFASPKRVASRSFAHQVSNPAGPLGSCTS